MLLQFSSSVLQLEQFSLFVILTVLCFVSELITSARIYQSAIFLQLHPDRFSHTNIHLV